MNSQKLIRVIAAREFMARIRTRVFVFNKSTTTSLEVGFVGAAQSIAAPVRAEAAAFGETITVHPYTSVAAGNADVQSGTIDALVSGSGARTTVAVQSAVDPTLQTVLKDVAQGPGLHE